MFDALKNRIRESLAHALGGWIRTAGNVSASMHVAGLDRPAENLLWIYLGMMARMDSIASVPLRISDSADRLIDSGPLADLLSRPNQVMDWVQYVGAIESYLALYNECDVAIVRDERGNPLELFPLNPRHCTPVTGVHVGTGVRIGVGWEYCDPTVGQRVAFAPEDVIPMVRISPYDFTRGIWTERPGRRAMQIDILAQEQNLAVFKNGGMPDVIFETDQRWTPEQSDEFLGRWQDRYGGSANAHKPGILYGGLKAKPIGLSPEDLQFFEGRRMSRSEQIALMRVKPAMVGLMEGETGLSQGSSTVEQYASWWRSIGLGELALISSAHQRFLVERHAFSGTRPTRELSVRERAACADHRQRQIRHGIRAPKQTALYVWFDEHEIEELMVTRLQKIDLFEKLCARGYPPDSAGEYLGLRLPPHPANRGLVAFSLQPVEDVAGPAVPEREAPMAHGREDRLDGLFARLDGALAEASIPAAVREDEAPTVPPRWRGLRVAARSPVRSKTATSILAAIRLLRLAGGASSSATGPVGKIRWSGSAR
jgi:HK97 family phage portal protein